MSILGLISHFKCGFKSFQEKKKHIFSLQGFTFMCCRWNIYRRALIPRKLPCPEKSLVTRLPFEKYLLARYLNTFHLISGKWIALYKRNFFLAKNRVDKVLSLNKLNLKRTYDFGITIRTSCKWNVYVKNLRQTWKYTYLYVNVHLFLEIGQPLLDKC